ncbi:MAG: 5-formyltetrahydrofolate cyclo-ligase [Anaeromyxobacteraceae bacterium]
MSSTPQSAAKRALRDPMLALRAGLPPAFRAEASREVAARLATLPAWERAGTVALHATLGAEVSTDEIARRAAAAGKRIAWPRLAAGGRAMEFAACGLGELVPGPSRALEPPASAPVVPVDAVDLVVVPGVAFDARGGRLGRGRGHYDATLPLLRPGAARIGIAFEVQVVPEVPGEAHDVALDAVVTEKRVLGPMAARSGGAPG